MKKFATRTDFTSFLRGESLQRKIDERERIHYEEPETEAPATGITLSVHSQDSGVIGEKKTLNILDPRDTQRCRGGRRHWALEYEDGLELKPGVRLHRVTHGGLARVLSLVPKPKLILPPHSMPKWKDKPVNEKIPLLPGPPDAVWFCRGKLGHELGRRRKTVFTVQDEHNRRKLIKTPYNALHDPHAKSYLQRPAVQRHLQKQGLVTGNGDVVCNVRQYNAYRRFVSEQYNEKVLNVLTAEEKLRTLRHNEHVELKQYTKKVAQGPQAKKRSQYNQVLDRKKNLDIKYEVCTKETVFQRKKKDVVRHTLLHKVDKLGIYARQLRDEYRLDCYKRGKLQGWDNKAKTMIRIMKNEHMQLSRLLYDREITRELFYLAGFEKFKRRFQLNKAAMLFREKLHQALEAKAEINARKRQIRYEVQRTKIKQLLDAEVKRKQYLKLNVRNFFHHWLDRARRRLKQRPNDEHISAFPIQKLIEKYTRVILSKFDKVGRKKDFELARKKLLLTMDAHVKLPLPRTPAPSIKTHISLIELAHLSVNKHKELQAEEWRIKWYEAHRNPELMAKLLEEHGGVLPKDKKHDFIQDHVHELHEMEAKNREHKLQELNQEDRRVRTEEAQHQHNLKLANKHRALIDPNLTNVGTALPEWVLVDSTDPEQVQLRKLSQSKKRRKRRKRGRRIKKAPKKIYRDRNPRRKLKDLETELLRTRHIYEEDDEDDEDLEGQMDLMIDQMVQQEQEQLQEERKIVAQMKAAIVAEAAEKKRQIAENKRLEAEKKKQEVARKKREKEEKKKNKNK